MKGELLELIPQKYLCPKCGKWHKYTWDQNLGYYDSSDYAIEMHCPNIFGIIEVYFANDRCYWNEGDQCYWCKISEFSEIGESRVQMIDSKNNFRLGFEFKPEEYAQVYAAEILEEANRKEKALHEREKELTLREKKLEEYTDITDANRIAYVGADNIATGRAAAALLGMVMQGHGSVLPILGQRSGHYADSQRFTGFSTEMAESFPDIRVLHPECSFLDESLAERIAMRAIQSDSELRGIYLTSAGREGVYRAVHAVHRSEKLHIVVHDITEGNIKMVKNGTVDFIIGQDVKTQGTLPIRLLYDYLERHQFPRERMNMTDITIKFRGNV